MITEKEYNYLIHKIRDNNIAKNYTKQPHNDEVRPLPEEFLQTEE